MSEQTKTWNKYIHKVQNYETDQMGIVHHSFGGSGLSENGLLRRYGQY